MSVVGRIMDPFPEDIYILIPETYENVMLHHKGELRLWMELRLLT